MEPALVSTTNIDISPVFDQFPGLLYNFSVLLIVNWVLRKPDRKVGWFGLQNEGIAPPKAWQEYFR